MFTNSHYKKIGKIFLLLSIMSCVFFIIRYYVLKIVPNNDFIPNNNFLALEPDYISQKTTAFFILLRYILLLIFPYPLCHDYSYAEIPIHNISNISSIIAIMIYLFITVYAFIKIRHKNILAFSILFYLLTIVPVSNILILIGSPMAERFLYMPSLGFCMAIAYLLMKVTKTDLIKDNFNSINTMVAVNKSLFSFVLILLMFYSFLVFADRKSVM